MESGRSRYTVPVFMVYSYDDYFHSHPNDLIEVANRLSGSGFGTVFSEKDMELITYLSDDTSRPFGLSYKSDMTFGREIVVSTVILSKPNLCNKKLCNKLLYLAVRGQYAAAIPAWYYSTSELSFFWYRTVCKFAEALLHNNTRRVIIQIDITSKRRVRL